MANAKKCNRCENIMIKIKELRVLMDVLLEVFD